MGYALDIYWKGDSRRVSFQDFLLYMSFFPQIMAGPIARSESFVPQIKKKKVFNYDDVANGLRRILWGLFKKIVIAENLKQYVDAVYDNPNMHHGLTIVVATLFYTFQLYCDFSGYSDIAIGSARIFGYKLIENFKVPLLSKSISEFWRRWHISLSSWVRDYVNNPIQYRYRHLKSIGVIIAVFATFMIIGAWHGPRWNYMIFGVIMVIAISFELFLKDWRDRFWGLLPSRLSNVLSTIIVFLVFSFCGMFLRSESLSDVMVLLNNASFSMDRFYTGSTSVIMNAIVGMLILAITDLRMTNSQFDEFINGNIVIVRWAYYLGLTIAILSIGVLDGGNFIYFQF
jgi:D-alanyl-lipoteichoic acid acyltransferase DltB (MBOAT superfamily)